MAFILPTALVWITAGILVVLRIENHRRAALVALAGIALSLLQLIGGTLINSYTPFFLMEADDMQSAAMFLNLIGMARSILGVIPLGVVMAGLIMALGGPDHSDEAPE